MGTIPQSGSPLTFLSTVTKWNKIRDAMYSLGWERAHLRQAPLKPQAAHSLYWNLKCR